MKGRQWRKSTGRRQNNEEQSRGSISSLPYVLITDILLRLPVKTIIQCRCVCKTWRDLLLDSYCIRSLSARACPTLIIRAPYGRGFSQFYMVELESGREALMKLNTRNNLPSCRVELVGSCNGCLCLFDMFSRKSFYLCNPITGQYVNTPPKAKKEKKSLIGKGIDVAHGFGFGRVTGSYKVVRITKKLVSHPQAHVVTVGEIHTFGTENWRTIKNAYFPDKWRCSVYKKQFGVPLCGSLHWIVEREVEVEYQGFPLICALDIDSEQIRPIPAPSLYSDWSLVIAELGGCLSVSDHTDFSKIEIWVMKDYGVKESWTKEIVIDTNMIPRRLRGCLWKTVMYGTDGEVLISVDRSSDLFLYDAKGKCVKDVIIHNVGSNFEVTRHVANFGSLGHTLKGVRVKTLRVKDSKTSIF